MTTASPRWYWKKYRTSGKRAPPLPPPGNIRARDHDKKTKIAKRRVRSVTAELLGKRLAFPVYGFTSIHRRGKHTSGNARTSDKGGPITRLSAEYSRAESDYTTYQYHRCRDASLIDPFYPLVLDELAQRIQSSGLQVLLFIIPPEKAR